MTSGVEGKSLDEVCEWLEDEGFPDSVVSTFRENDLDGTAIAFGLGTTPSPDWLKDVVPSLGLRLKVHNALRAWHATGELSSPEPNCGSSQLLRELSPLSSGEGSSLRSPPASTVSVSGGSSKCGVHSKGLTSTPKRKVVSSLPHPFPIPKFRQDTEENLKEKCLTDTDRRYVVQTLATVLMTHIQRPSLADCEVVARTLVEKFDFLSDDEGDGVNSWKWFIYYRCQNVNRRIKVDGTPQKRPKLAGQGVHFYPPVHADDDASYERNLQLLKAETDKVKPSSDVLKELMRRTFPNRWDAYVTKSEPSTLAEYLAAFPLLKKATYATLDFALICNKENLRERFEEQFPLWVRTIIVYCKNTQIKSSALQEETANYYDDLPEDRCVHMALRCLVLLFAPMKTKKLESSNVPYILKIVPRGTSPADAMEKGNNQPHMVLFSDMEDEDCLAEQHFISVEQGLMLETSNIVASIFFCIAAHYIFNLAYHAKTGDVWVFIQEKVLGIPSRAGVKRHPSNLTHFSGISRMYETLMTKRNSED